MSTLLTRLGVGLLWVLHFLPLSVLAPIGAGLGAAAFHLVANRRRVCLVNLALCFPELSEAERRRLAKRHFRALGRSFIERGILLWGAPGRIRSMVRVEGIEHIERLEREGTPIILLAPHFVGLDAGATRMAMDREASSMYARQKDPYIDALLRKARNRFKPIRLFSRQEGLRGIVRALRERLPCYYLPDMDFGPQDSAFIPFFGVPAATITGVPRLAKLGRARVVPIVTRMLPGAEGYVTRLFPPWENYPTDDPIADTRRVNAFIEAEVRTMPEQYYWVHKRFKTRPPGAPRVYD